MKTKIIASDFDGTLCENKWPEIGEPNNEVINYLKEQKQLGARLILWTCRDGEKLTEAVNWCRHHGLQFDAVNENLPDVIEEYGGDTRKISATEYIDDRISPKFRLPYRGLFDNELITKATALLDVAAGLSIQIPQSVYLMEEMSELTKELTKEQRFRGNIEHIKEEIADVICTLLTYSSSVNIDFHDVRTIILSKFNRGIERLSNNEL